MVGKTRNAERTVCKVDQNLDRLQIALACSSCIHCNLFYMIYFTSRVICCTPATAASLRQDNMFIGSLMITTQAVCGDIETKHICH